MKFITGQQVTRKILVQSLQVFSRNLEKSNRYECMGWQLYTVGIS